MARIVVSVYNHSGYLLKKQSIPVRGRFRFQLLAAAKVLSILSTIKELYGDIASHARIELVNVGDAKMFSSLVASYSPLKVEIIKKREVVENAG